MNATQIKLISDFHRQIIDDGDGGDLASAYMATKDFISSLRKTDKKLNDALTALEYELEEEGYH